MRGFDKSSGVPRWAEERVLVPGVGGPPIQTGQREAPSLEWRRELQLEHNAFVRTVYVTAAPQQQTVGDRSIHRHAHDESHVSVPWVGRGPNLVHSQGFVHCIPGRKVRRQNSHPFIRSLSCAGVSPTGPSATPTGLPGSEAGSFQQSTRPRLRVQNGGASNGGSGSRQ
jgi:hypothetical protein